MLMVISEHILENLKSLNKYKVVIFMIKAVKNITSALAGVAQVVAALSHTPKGGQFDSQLGHVPRLLVQFPAWAVWEAPSGCFSVALMFLSFSVSLSLPPLPSLANQ